jgi:excisionase family DNA binding protein
MDGTDGKLLLTIGEAAARLSVGRSFLYGLVMRGEIASVKLGRSRRIPVVALERFVHERLREGEE